MARLLFIEPDRLLAENVGQLLAVQGHGVDWQPDPQAAMDSADAILPDVIVCELIMAGRSGVEFLYEFRSYPEWFNVPVVLYTNVAPEEYESARVSLEQLNVSAYHYKPTTTAAQLADSIDKVLAGTKV